MKLFIPKQFVDFKAVDGHEIVFYGPEDDVSQADVIVGNPKAVLADPSKFPNLKFLQLRSAGYDAVPVEAMKQQGILLANARGLYSVPIAEYALAHLLAHYKRIHDYRKSQEAKDWNLNLSSLSLVGKRVLILGTGSIAFEISKRLNAFDAFVDGTNSDGRAIEGFEKTLCLDAVEDVLPNYDVVISALPSNKHTIHRVDAGFLRAMKQDSVFINVGRGDVLDEAILESSIEHLSCVILDVFESEPLAKDSFMWDSPKVIVTPHISYSSDHNTSDSLNFLHENVSRFVRGDLVDNLVYEL